MDPASAHPPVARRNIMLGTAGHVDHGKTALVKLLTGCNTDTLAEEQARGLTIDLGFAPCRLADQRVVGIVDVPGHIDFIRNMVAGAHGIDLVILVIAADDSVMPQTREHLNILTLMGLRHGLVALTKIDLLDPGLRPAVMDDVRRLLDGTFLAQAPICPLSNLTGEGFDAFFDTLNDRVNACHDRPCTGLFRAWIADVLSIHGFGTVATAIPAHGQIRVTDRLQVLPAGQSARVRHLQVYGVDATVGRAGECVALNLPDLDHTALRRGMMLTTADALAPVTQAEAELHLLDSLRGALPDYAEVHLHVGTASLLARVALLEHAPMTAGQSQMVQLRFAEPLPLAPGDRFVIRATLAGGTRSQSILATLGGGRILSTTNRRLRRNKPWTLATLRARRDALDDPALWCARLLEEAGRPCHTADLARIGLWETSEAETYLAQARSCGLASQTPQGDWLHTAVVRRACDQLLSALDDIHRSQPESLGPTAVELAALSGVAPALLTQALDQLLAHANVRRHGDRLALASWQPRRAPPDDPLLTRLAGELDKAGYAPPGLDALATSLGQSPARIQALARQLIETGLAVRIAEGLFVHCHAVEQARQAALALFRRAPTFSTMDFRDALGVSRKFAVPLLDYLDATRFTVRNGHTRTPGAGARQALASTHFSR
jgi:selenocysteine-specific elongation factor